jgi:UDP-glucose 4-epimerase
MRAVVTGGAGFIGSHVAAALAARGDEVHVLDNLSTGLREYVPEGVKLHVGDIREAADLDLVFDESAPDVCFHLAAQADVGTSVAEPVYDAEVNVLGTVRVLEAARRHGAQVVFSSTGGAIYGECDSPAAEGAARRPLSPYGTAKLAAEEYLATWNRLHGTRHVSLRFANVYGPHQAAGLEGGVVAIFLERMAGDATSTIYGDGSQTRDFVYVGDVVRAVLAAAGHDGGVFNVGTGIETSVSALYEACGLVAGFERPTEHAPARPGDLKRSVLDAALAAAELGWRPETSLESGLAETWSWIQAQ